MPSQQILVGTPTAKIPLEFARRFPDAIGPDDAGRLLAGPESLTYWDTWDSVLGYAQVRIFTWLRWDGNLWMEWDRPVYRWQPIRPWPQGAEPELPGWFAFRQALNRASYHNAAEPPEITEAKWYIEEAAWLAINYGWPYWALKRACSEGKFLVDFDAVMQTMFNLLGAE